ncbi:hypothetical protein G6F46_001358 [Rhizopus delemar]|uniref:FYR N-terminal domain-containing protein n=2 Tax=Rhizopus TaxID=4842 RepID=A0A9P6ZC05_9FUNG|nr:hypothetical protein G6F43_008543 [Rhizopus delemar]KAG1553082.1 hypothetical protein G6F51_000816 [Rhizopus arrhizus]KAG1465676.1 hypothetical protein G6F55_000986 [Rhizopus delemar]KAG1504263.1 hypothetical protein G6F54_001126 [Rhizopus delemar]KAG1517306.1 hypothetical protein G6F53_001470 [Rhizopus delemar]
MSINKILSPTSQSPILDKTAKDDKYSMHKKWINVPLKQCLISVCSSCPDQLIHKDAAVYSANFEESTTVENWSPLHDVTSNIVWEGHGLLSSVMNDKEQFVTGKIVHSTMPKTYECQIEVLIQLQPLQSLPSSPPTENYLPPMRSLWNYTPNPKISSPPPPPHPLPALPWGRTESNLHLPIVQKHVDCTDYSNRQWSSNQHDTSQDQGLKRKENTLEQQESVKKPKQETMTIRSITSTGTTDTYFHQSRRKKRDTKPPNANDIRPFIEVEKNKLGQYVLPAEVDSWTVLNLGTVVWDRAAFHNQRYIYPVGYCVKKWYRSMIDPHSDTQYTCEILDGGEEPIFQLNADDNPNECWRGPTPTTVWTIVVRRAFAIRNMDYGHNPVGPDFFGLRKNTIAKMIQDLPNADKCKNYIWQNFEAISNTKGKSVRRSSSRLGSSSNDRQLIKSPEDQSSSSSGASSPLTDNEA